MQDNCSTRSTFNQLYEPIDRSAFLQEIREMKTDKYTKKLYSDRLFALLASAQMEQCKSLVEISNQLQDEDFSKAIGLSSISASQISRKLRTVPTSVLKSMLNRVVQKAISKIGANRVRQGLGRIYLIDSTTIGLSLTRYPWASFRKTKSGIKVHLRLSFWDKDVLPDAAIITAAKKADKTQMDDLVVTEKDVLNVFDRGYVDYKKFDSYCANEILFVSRLKSNALIHVEQSYDVSPGSPIIKDEKVILGKDSLNQMKHSLRLIEVTDTQGNIIRILTNAFQRKAEEIGELYRNRWQIELFFKWIKQHFTVKHFYGQSPQAVENQVYIALITYVLLVLLHKKCGYSKSLLQFCRVMKQCLYEDFQTFIKKLYQRHGPTSKGRRKVPNHKLVFDLTIEQAISGDTCLLHSLDIDPVIL
jgi:hypothetical protein